jgi:DNA topoisomerase-1
LIKGVKTVGYTLIISEKNEAARRIASALDDKGSPDELKVYGVSYYSAISGGKQLIIAPAVGHLYTIAPEKKGRNFYPVFDVHWVPTHSVNKKAQRTEKWIKTLEKLSNEATDFISATDYDIEGEVIGYTVLKYACGGKENIAKRMKFSTLTESELREAYQNLYETIDFNLAEAGETRHVLDFLWGVNLSRALTIALKKWSKRYATISTGRVQSPTLKFLVDREKEILSFVPEPYWNIKSEVLVNDKTYKSEYEKKRIERKVDAEEIILECKNLEGVIESISSRTFKQNPPAPLNLSELQSEAYKLFKYNPSRTLRGAESLYLKALISYPRTSSQKLPSSINYYKILNSLKRITRYSRLVEKLLSKEKLKPTDGRGNDSAHPAIYPTGNHPENNITALQKRLYDLIVRRFLAVFSESATKQSLKASIKIGKHTFYLRGRRILKKGWISYYAPYTETDEILLPPIKENQRIKFKKIEIESRFTSPPPRYNQSSLLKAMEKEELGTKTTRSTIIETILNRGYVHFESMVVSPLGLGVVETLEKFALKIVSIEFTRELEKDMSLIEEGRLRKSHVLLDSTRKLKPILEKMKAKEKEIGSILEEAVRKARLVERTVGLCPVCKTGDLIIITSKKTGKRFVGCSNWRKGLCNASFPLPQKPHTITTLKKKCPICGWPRVLVRSKRRRYWNLCLNQNCPQKKTIKTRTITMKNQDG